MRAKAMLAEPVAIDLLHASVDVLAASELRLKHAESLVELGAALRRANHRADARGPLATGIELADIAGAAPLAERARAELTAAGGRPRSVERSGVASLTPSERRVAQLAAEGLTNREIAQQLFVSVKTIEKHMASCLRKLQIDSRRELRRVSIP